jgi:hypothetical protein
VQTDVHVDVAKGFPRQPDIAGVIFDQENLYEPLPLCDGIHGLVPVKAMRTLETCADCDSNETLPKMLLTRRPAFFLLIGFAPAAAT